jgi:hypothetical protein
VALPRGWRQLRELVGSKVLPREKGSYRGKDFYAVVEVRKELNATSYATSKCPANDRELYVAIGVRKGASQ